MPEYLPGPFWLRDEPPDQTPVYTAGALLGLLEELAATLGASDTVLTPLAATIATVNDDGLATEYATTVDVAGETVANQRDVDGDQTAAALLETGGAVDAYRAEVAPHLPGVDTPIPLDFVDTPGPPPGGPPEPGEGTGEPPPP